ncbi:hypothetical protein KCU85_g310, partial [Aureobasidium melanogenum]
MGIEGKAMEYDFEERLRTEVHIQSSESNQVILICALDLSWREDHQWSTKWSVVTKSTRIPQRDQNNTGHAPSWVFDLHRSICTCMFPSFFHLVSLLSSQQKKLMCFVGCTKKFCIINLGKRGSELLCKIASETPNQQKKPSHRIVPGGLRTRPARRACPPHRGREHKQHNGLSRECAVQCMNQMDAKHQAPQQWELFIDCDSGCRMQP